MIKPHSTHLIEKAEAQARVGGPEIFHELCLLGGLKPMHHAKGFHFFDWAEVEAAQKRRLKMSGPR